jgi:hypothetical protein
MKITGRRLSFLLVLDGTDHSKVKKWLKRHVTRQVRAKLKKAWH